MQYSELTRGPAVYFRRVLDESRADGGTWFGGNQHVAAPFEWPKDPTGEPMLFLAQIDCSELPSALWNGHGPRAGFILFFVSSHWQHTHTDPFPPATLPCTILHTMETGQEQPRPICESTIESYDIHDLHRKRHGGSPVHYPRWSMTLTQSPPEKNPSLDDYEWPLSDEQTWPVDWHGLEMIIGSLTARARVQKEGGINHAVYKSKFWSLLAGLLGDRRTDSLAKRLPRRPEKEYTRGGPRHQRRYRKISAEIDANMVVLETAAAEAAELRERGMHFLPDKWRPIMERVAALSMAQVDVTSSGEPIGVIRRPPAIKDVNVNYRKDRMLEVVQLWQPPETRDLIHPPVRRCFEDLWAHSTSNPPYRMGGDAGDDDLFLETVFNDDGREVRARMIAKGHNPVDDPMDWSAGTPFEGINHLLLQLGSEDTQGWMWGDMGKITFAEPPRVYRRVSGSMIRLLFRQRSSLHRRPPLLLAA